MATRKFRNPFHYGNLVSDEAFTDREQELAQLEADIQNGHNVAIIAPRRFGKSSLVRTAISELLADDVLVVEVDLMTTPTKEKLAGKLAKSIHDDIASVVFGKRYSGCDDEGDPDRGRHCKRATAGAARTIRTKPFTVYLKGPKTVLSLACSSA